MTGSNVNIMPNIPNTSKPIRSRRVVAEIFHLSLLWVLFTATGPFLFFKAIPGHPNKYLVAAGLVIMSVMLFLRQKVNLGDRIIPVILFVQACYCLLATLLHELFFLGMEEGYAKWFMQFISVAIVYLYIQSFFCIHKVSKSSIYMIASMGIMGGSVFFLGLFGLISPFTTFEKMGGGVVYNFLLTFSNSVSFMNDFTIVRVAGFFDEPGTFAYYITFALLTNKLYSYSKRLEWILVVTGLFTLSLAFIITLMFYYFIFYNPVRSLKSLSMFSLLVLIIMLCSAYSDSVDSEIGHFIHKQTIGRLYAAEESDMLFVGDNRSGLLKESWVAFAESPFIGHGESLSDNISSKYYNINIGANLFSPLAKHGIIGTLIFFSAFIYWGYLIFVHPPKRDRVAVGAWVIVFINFIQRPEVTGGLYGYFAVIFLVEATRYRLLSLKT